MKPYIAHQSQGRVRVRSSVFAFPPNREKAREMLRDLPGVEDIREGANSLLILLGEGADRKKIFEKLEAAFPELNSEEKPKACPNCRKIWLRSLLAAGITTVGLAITGPYKLHAWAGVAFAALATHHVWKRRKAL